MVHSTSIFVDESVLPHLYQITSKQKPVTDAMWHDRSGHVYRVSFEQFMEIANRVYPFMEWVSSSVVLPNEDVWEDIQVLCQAGTQHTEWSGHTIYSEDDSSGEWPPSVIEFADRPLTDSYSSDTESETDEEEPSDVDA